MIVFLVKQIIIINYSFAKFKLIVTYLFSQIKFLSFIEMLINKNIYSPSSTMNIPIIISYLNPFDTNKFQHISTFQNPH